jgi:hypothetical protein
MEKTRVTTSVHDPQRMTEKIDMKVKEGDPETTTIMAITTR